MFGVEEESEGSDSLPVDKARAFAGRFRAGSSLAWLSWAAGVWGPGSVL